MPSGYIVFYWPPFVFGPVVHLLAIWNMPVLWRGQENLFGFCNINGVEYIFLIIDNTIQVQAI